MLDSDVPNWLRLVLFVLTSVSFLPQIRLLLLQRESSGINLYCQLFNLIVATELFALGFFYLINASSIEGSDFFVHEPPNVGDWINLVQLTATWLLFLLTFALCVTFSSRSTAAVTTVYFSFLLISVIPIFLDATGYIGDKEARRWWGAVFHAVHTLFLAPVITLLAALALPAQARTILSRPPGSGTGALSVGGLAVQAVIFALLAVSWYPGRLVFPYSLPGPDRAPLRTWYQLVGFLPVDHAVFALVQGILFLIALWHQRRRGRVMVEETEPLLSR